jgi:glycosyltransferase involved in cell wall biosynthesis
MLAENVKALLSDEVMADKMGQAGQKLVEEKFNLPDIIDQYYNLMNQIVG